MSGSSYTQVPTIILKGQWLKAAGFEAGKFWTLCLKSGAPVSFA